MKRKYSYSLYVYLTGGKTTNSETDMVDDFNSIFDIIKRFRDDVEMIQKHTKFDFKLFGEFELENAPGFKDGITLNVSYHSDEDKFYWGLYRGKHEFSIQERDLIALFSEEYVTFCKQLNTKDINKIVSVVKSNCSDRFLSLKDPRKYHTDGWSKAVSKIILEPGKEHFYMYKDNGAKKDECIATPNEVKFYGEDFIFNGKYKGYGFITELNGIQFIRCVAFSLANHIYQKQYPNKTIDLWNLVASE